MHSPSTIDRFAARAPRGICAASIATTTTSTGTGTTGGAGCGSETD
jgi:hypothetical protein